MVFVERAENDINWQAIKRRWGRGQSNGRVAATPRNATGYNRTRTKYRRWARSTRRYRSSFKRNKRSFRGRRKFFRRRRFYRRRGGRGGKYTFQKKVQAVINKQIPWTKEVRSGYMGAKWSASRSYWWNIGCGQSTSGPMKWIRNLHFQIGEDNLYNGNTYSSSLASLCLNALRGSISEPVFRENPYKLQIVEDSLKIIITNPCSFPITVTGYLCAFKMDNSIAVNGVRTQTIGQCILESLSKAGIIQNSAPSSPWWQPEQFVEVTPYDGELAEREYKILNHRTVTIIAGGKTVFYLPTTSRGYHKTSDIFLRQYMKKFYREYVFLCRGPHTHTIGDITDTYIGGGAVNIQVISRQKSRILQNMYKDDQLPFERFRTGGASYSNNYGGATPAPTTADNLVEVQVQNMNKPGPLSDYL